jgi:small subunit ribosomal protein S35
MASPAYFLRLCLRPSRRVPSLCAAAVRQSISRRPLSTTQWRPAAPTDNASKNEFQEEVDEEFGNPGQFLKSFLRDENISEKERALATRMLQDWEKVPPKQQQEFDRLNEQITEEAAELRRPVRAKKQSFWNAEEVDTDLITDEIGEDDFEEDDMMAMGHAKLEEHREFREYARVAVWEMPLLSSKLAGAVLFLG